MRIDKYLVEKKIYLSRNKAQNAIYNKLVFVNGKLITNNHFFVKNTDSINVINKDLYVSRGALKLLGAIKKLQLDIKNFNVVDVGSSTGGFTQVLLEQKANHVFAIDVGSNQLVSSLRNNKKVTLFEKTHFNKINKSMFPMKIDLIVADVSFISLTKLLVVINQVFDYRLKLLFLIKPQFELSRSIINKCHGVIKSKKMQNLAITKIESFAKSINFKVVKIFESDILGKEGNKEFFIYMFK